MVRIDQWSRRSERRHGAHQSFDVVGCAALEEIDLGGGAHIAGRADGRPADEHVLHGLRIQCTDEIEEVGRKRHITAIVRLSLTPMTRHLADFVARMAAAARWTCCSPATSCDTRATTVRRSAASDNGGGGAG